MQRSGRQLCGQSYSDTLDLIYPINYGLEIPTTLWASCSSLQHLAGVGDGSLVRRKHHVLSAGLNRGDSESGWGCSGYTLVIQQNLGQIIHVGVCSPANKGQSCFLWSSAFYLQGFHRAQTRWHTWITWTATQRTTRLPTRHWEYCRCYFIFLFTFHLHIFLFLVLLIYSLSKWREWGW